MEKTSHDSEIKAKGQQVITVCALINRFKNTESEIFLAKRSINKKFLPGVFELPGGHVDFRENLVRALKREVMEEFEVEISVGDVLAALDYYNPIKESHAVEIVYFAKIIDFDSLKLHPEDHENFIWIKEAEVSKICCQKKNEEDQEIQIIKKAFNLLNSGTKLMNTG